MLRWLFQYALILALSLWVGGITFFWMVTAPGIIRSMDRDQAGALLSRLLPDYYLAGTLCGLVALALLAPLFLFDSGSRLLRFFQIFLVALMLAANFYGGNVLERQVARLGKVRIEAPSRGEREEAARRFDQLRGRSLTLNLALLCTGVAVLGTTAVRKRAPA